MRRLAILLAVTAVGLILVLTFRTRAPDAPVAQAPTPSISRPAEPGSTSATGSTPAAASTPATLPAGAHTATGTRVSTDWGFVQVRVRIAGGRLVDVVALEVPHGNPTDVDINRSAVPQLRAAALAAQGANIDTISGATVTSVGYRRSLQSALDRLP